MLSLIRVVSAALLLLTFAVLAAVPQRAQVDAVATIIEAKYFDAKRGASIAAELREESAQGRYDAARDSDALAEALTRRLKPLDRHFRVRSTAVRPALPGPRRRKATADEVAAPPALRAAEVMPGNIGYLSLGHFAHFEFGHAGEPAREAIDGALVQLAGTRTMIIDLRDNRGGSPHMVGYLVSAFTPRGADIYNTFHTRTATFSEAPAEFHRSPRTQVPVYILVNGRTGSAAEAFTYTLQNAGRATVVGESTGGAANPGEEFDLGNGFAVFVSTGTPVSPVTGRNWEGTGVVPDVQAASDDALQVATGLATADAPGN